MRKLAPAALLLALVAQAAILGCAPVDWNSRLYSPTLITKLGPHYFIIDCWHNRVLYSRTIEPDLLKWRVLSDDLAGPHSIDSDGRFYVVEDTGRHRLRVFTLADDLFTLVQTIDGVGRRPHRVRYDHVTRAFWVIGSKSGTISKLVAENDRLVLAYTREIPDLRDLYTRSMTFVGEEMYVISSTGIIRKFTYRDDRFEPLASYRVPYGYEDMNDLFVSDRAFYVTATSNRILRTASLEDMERGSYQDLQGILGFGGTPYYLSHFDGRFHVALIRKHSGIVSFLEGRDGVTDVHTVLSYGAPRPVDIQEMERLPK